MDAEYRRNYWGNNMVLTTDIFECSDKFCIQVDLPGIDQTTLDVSVSNGFLNIKGERKKMDSTLGNRIGGYNERVYGPVQRSIPLPLGSNEDKMEAKIENGVLTGTVTFVLMLQ
jgi:HSP20 family protein